MTIELPPWLGLAVLLIVCSGAFMKGGVEERLAAAGLLISVGVTFLLRDPSWPHVQIAGFVMDALVLALFLGIALTSPKYWPMAAAGFQLLAVLTHIGKMIDPQVDQWAYITAIVIWTYLVIIALGVGVWNTWRRRALLAQAVGEAGGERRSP